MTTVYYINCADSLDRNDWIRSHLRDLQLIPFRCEAIVANSIEFEPPYTKGGYACLLSHLWWQNAMADMTGGWQLIVEDDVKLLGVPDVRTIVASAPRDATLLQLTTLSGHHYQSEKPLWTRSINGYYGTQAYLVRVASIRTRMRMFGIDDNLSRYLSEPLPSIKGGMLVADSYTYAMHRAYICSFPFAYADIKFGSLLHPDHLDMHEDGWRVVREHASKFRNPFIKEVV